MRAGRIRRGMHRLGMALAAVPLLIVVIGATPIIFEALRTYGPQGQFFNTEHIGRQDVWLSFVFLFAAAILYAACWLLGWVIAGFLADE